MKKIIKNCILVIICVSSLQTSNVHGKTPTPTMYRTLVGSGGSNGSSGTATNITAPNPTDAKTQNMCWPVTATERLTEAQWLQLRQDYAKSQSQEYNESEAKRQHLNAREQKRSEMNSKIAQNLNNLNPSTMYNLINQSITTLNETAKGCNQLLDKLTTMQETVRSEAQHVQKMYHDYNTAIKNIESDLNIEQLLNESGVTVDEIVKANPGSSKQSFGF